MKPIKFKLEPNPAQGGHITFTVRAGRNEGSLASCGTLTMRNDEYKEFAALFGVPTPTSNSIQDDLARVASTW